MFFCFCFPHTYGTWLPLPEMVASNTTVKLTPNGEFHRFSPFHCPGRSWFAAFAEWIWILLLFLNSFVCIGFKISLCAIAKKWLLKRCHCCFKSLLGKMLPKSWPFLKWESLVGKKIHCKCAFVLLHLECSYVLLLIWEVPDICCHSITFFSQKLFHNLKCNPGSH